MMARLLSKCQNLSSSIERVVDAIMDEKVCEGRGRQDKVIAI